MMAIINPEGTVPVTEKEPNNDTNASCSRESQPVAASALRPQSSFYESLRGHLGATENDDVTNTNKFIKENNNNNNAGFVGGDSADPDR